MSISQVKRCMLFIILGLLLLAIDVHVQTGINYPNAYQNDENYIGEFQYYNIKIFYGASCTFKEAEKVITSDSGNVSENSSNIYYTSAEFVDDVFFDGLRVDIFNDIIGLILIAICSFMMARYKKSFTPAYIFAIAGIVLKLILTSLPFILNGMILCCVSLGLGISYIAAIIITAFFVSRGYREAIKDTCCRDERLWLNTSWFIFMILIILIFLLKWLDLYGMACFFTVILVLDIVFFGFVLRRTYEFVARNCK